MWRGRKVAILCLVESEGDTADVTAALADFGDFRGKEAEATGHELGLELGRVGGHNYGLAGGDEVTGKPLGCFGVVDVDLVEW